MTPGTRTALQNMVANAKREPGTIESLALNGWRFVLSFDDPRGFGWHLSASLFPIGRGSVVEDWRFLGEASAVLGVPGRVDGEALLTPFDVTPPNAVHHWHWGAPPAILAAVRKKMAERAGGPTPGDVP